MSTAVSVARAARAQYDLAFQIAPIILQGGIAAGAQGGLLPITALFGQGQSSNSSSTQSTFFARFRIMPGGSIISYTVGEYPYATQQVAANAVIKQPNTFSLRMIAPVNQPGGYLAKLSALTAIQNAIDAHILAGGWFSVATPGFVYNNCLLLNITDITDPEMLQDQIEWQWDFRQPLITQQSAAAALNNLIQKITNGSYLPNPSWSGNSQATSPTSTAGLPAAQATFGVGFSSITTTQGGQLSAVIPGSAGGG